VSLLRSLIGREHGQALPEFALVLPLLAVVLFGVMHLGKALNYWNDATHISAEGARYAAVNGKPYPTQPGSLQAQLQAQGDTEELRDGGSSVENPAEVCIDFPNGTAGRGDPVRVTMKFQYTWIPLLGLGTGTEITSTAVMRLETAPTTYAAGCV
jgi:Flp pilus assembly protein TadG